MAEKSLNKNISMLDILTKNLDPDLAQQVKQNWVDSKKMCVENLIGHGKFDAKIRIPKVPDMIFAFLHIHPDKGGISLNKKIHYQDFNFFL